MPRRSLKAAALLLGLALAGPPSALAAEEPPKQDPEALDLRPVMTLSSALISIKTCHKGDSVGYGGAWRCPEDMPVGVVAIGYGDGYPRHAPPGTPVLVNGRRVPLIGRVSMDLVTVDLRGQAQAKVGDEVVLWGSGLPVEDIATVCGTISYELLCRVAERVPRVDMPYPGAR